MNSETTAQFPLVIDATMRSSFLLCPHHFFRRYCEGLQHEAAPSVHLHFGRAIARGLEVARRSFAKGEAPEQSMIAGTEALILSWGDFQSPRNPSRGEDNKTLDAAILALADYFHEWPLDRDPVQIARFAGEPCVEFSGRQPIPGCFHPATHAAIEYAGRFDMIGAYGGSYWGLDDKTTSYVSSSWADQWRLRGQFTGYSWLARAYDMPVLGMLVRGICILKGGTKLVPTVEIPQPLWAIDRWLAQLRLDVTRMIAYWCTWKSDEGFARATHGFPQILDTGCYSYARPCEFMPLCTSANPERWLSEYTVNRWNPLANGDSSE